MDRLLVSKGGQYFAGSAPRPTDHSRRIVKRPERVPLTHRGYGTQLVLLDWTVTMTVTSVFAGIDWGSTESTGRSFTEMPTVSPLIPAAVSMSVAACLICVELVFSTTATRQALRAASV